MIFTVEHDAHVFDQVNGDQNYTAHVSEINCHSYAPVELKEFAQMWKKALVKARRTRDYAPLARYMTDDFVYTWCLPGVDPTYFQKRMEAKGKEEVLNTVDIDTMIGEEGWEYPWIQTYIDPRKGVIFYMWKEVTPYQKKDGTYFEGKAPFVTRLDYVGGYKVAKMEDLVDCEFHIALVDETIAAGFASEKLIRKQNAYYRQLAKDYNAFYRHLEELCDQAGNDKAMIPELLDGYYSPYRNAVVKGIDTELENVDAYPVRSGNAPTAKLAPASVKAPEPASASLQEKLRKHDQTALSEHVAVRNRVGYYDFTHKLLEVTGIDARSFLSRIFVGAIAKAKIGQAKYTTMLNEEGRIIDDVIVFRIEEDKYWVSTLYIEELIAWLDSHRSYEDVHYTEITDITTMYAVQGPASRAVLNDILAENVSALKPFQIRGNAIGSTSVKIARSGYTGELGYEIYCRPEDASLVEAKLEQAGARFGILKITTDVIVTSLPREKGFVLMSDIGGLNPLECGFGWTIDWNKSFIGKKALEAVKVQGAAQDLLGFIVDDDAAVIEAGAEVSLNGVPVGRVTVFTYGFTLQKNLGFAVVDTKRAKIGDRVEIAGRDRKFSTVLTERVFYDPKNERTRESNIPALEKAALDILADQCAGSAAPAAQGGDGQYGFTGRWLEVAGLDARSFLCRMFVSPVAKAGIGQAKSTMLNKNGKIIDDVFVFRVAEDRYWVSAQEIEELAAWFDAHKTSEDVAYRVITGRTTMQAV